MNFFFNYDLHVHCIMTIIYNIIGIHHFYALMMTVGDIPSCDEP